MAARESTTGSFMHTLYLLGFPILEQALPQTETRQKRVTREEVLPPGEREAEAVGCERCHVCVCVCERERKKEDIDTKETEAADLLKQ